MNSSSDKAQKTTLFGGLVAAFLASICCLGPIIFALLGLTGVGFIAAFDTYRPYLIGLTLVLLMAGAYFTYRKKDECDPESLCANPKSSRSNKIIFWSIAALAIGFLFAPSLLGFLL